MDEKFRVRNNVRVLTLTHEQLAELDRMKSVLVDVDGMDVEFVVDVHGVSRFDAEHTKYLDEREPDRLLSGFPIQYYNVLDGRDLIVLGEPRLDGEEILVERAGGYLEIEDLYDFSYEVALRE